MGSRRGISSWRFEDTRDFDRVLRQVLWRLSCAENALAEILADSQIVAQYLVGNEAVLAWSEAVGFKDGLEFSLGVQ